MSGINLMNPSGAEESVTKFDNTWEKKLNLKKMANNQFGELIWTSTCGMLTLGTDFGQHRDMLKIYFLSSPSSCHSDFIFGLYLLYPTGFLFHPLLLVLFLASFPNR